MEVMSLTPSTALLKKVRFCPIATMSVFILSQTNDTETECGKKRYDACGRYTGIVISLSSVHPGPLRALVKYSWEAEILAEKMSKQNIWEM